MSVTYTIFEDNVNGHEFPFRFKKKLRADYSVDCPTILEQLLEANSECLPLLEMVPPVNKLNFLLTVGDRKIGCVLRSPMGLALGLRAHEMEEVAHAIDRHLRGEPSESTSDVEG